MPLPTPRQGESENQFIERCIRDDTMQGEFPDENQRLGVCYQRWQGKSTKGYKPRQWSTIDRRRAKFRGKYKPKMSQALDEHLNQFLDIISRTTDINSVDQYVRSKPVSSDNIEKVIKDLYVDTGSYFANFDRRQAKKRAGITYIEKDEDDIYASIITDEMRAWIEENIGQKISVIRDTSKQEVIRILRSVVPEILEEGLSGSEAQAALRDKVENEWLRFKRYRTERIIRTEVTPASMVGSMKGVESTGIEHVKIWSAAFRDTREDHKHASGQKAEMDEPFRVGGEDMRYPGDPRGSAGNVINCQCALTYEVK
jgi:hypothetical protein